MCMETETKKKEKMRGEMRGGKRVGKHGAPQPGYSSSSSSGQGRWGENQFALSSLRGIMVHWMWLIARPSSWSWTLVHLIGFIELSHQRHPPPPRRCGIKIKNFDGIMHRLDCLEDPFKHPFNLRAWPYLSTFKEAILYILVPAGPHMQLSAALQIVFFPLFK